MKVLKVVLLIVGVGIIVLIGLFLRALYAKDIADFTEPQLSLEKITDSLSQNAYYDLAKIPKNINVDSPELIYFDQAADKTLFIDPTAANPDAVTLESNFPNLVLYRAAAKSRISKADLLLSQGKNQEAFLVAEKVVKVGNLIANSQSPLLHYLVGISISKLGWEELDKISVSSLDANFKAKHYAILAKCKDTRAGLRNALKFEYLLGYKALTTGEIKNITDKYQTNIIAGQMKLLPFKTKQILATKYLEWFSDLERQCPIDFKPTSYAPSDFTVYFTENSVGKILVDMITNALGNLPTKLCELEGDANKVLNKLK